MLENPNLPEEQILNNLLDSYGLRACSLEFLPIGYDVNTVVYRVEADQAYFLKLRKGDFNPIAVTLPEWLQTRGGSAIREAVIAPLKALDGRLLAQVFIDQSAYQMILYPYVTGLDGYTQDLTDAQWLAFGEVLRDLHAANLPGEMSLLIPREDFSPAYRDLVRRFQDQVGITCYDDPVAEKLAVFLRSHREQIDRLVAWTDAAAQSLQERADAPEELAGFVLCHNDIHPGNLLITSQKEAGHSGLYLVDWDAPIYAPRERDLALIGGSYTWRDPRQTALFYQAYQGEARGYGPARVDREAIGYYRRERILTDIAEFCKQLLLTPEGGADREQAYQYCTSSFLPGRDVELVELE